MKIKSVLFLLCLTVLLGACRTTDPSQGGLFSYSPEAYEARKAERRDRLKELQREQIAEEMRRDNLEASKQSKKSQQAALKKQVQTSSRDMKALETKLNKYQATNEKQEEALKDLQARQANLKSDLQAINTSPMDETGKRVEAERLRREIERLSNDTADLSSL